jgi:hypothetical protein
MASAFPICHDRLTLIWDRRTCFLRSSTALRISDTYPDTRTCSLVLAEVLHSGEGEPSDYSGIKVRLLIAGC